MKSARRFQTERFESLKSFSISIMVKNTRATHFHQLLLKDVTSYLPIWILSSTEVQIHSLKAVTNS